MSCPTLWHLNSSPLWDQYVVICNCNVLVRTLPVTLIFIMLLLPCVFISKAWWWLQCWRRIVFNLKPEDYWESVQQGVGVSHAFFSLSKELRCIWASLSVVPVLWSIGLFCPHIRGMSISISVAWEENNSSGSDKRGLGAKKCWEPGNR